MSNNCKYMLKVICFGRIIEFLKGFINFMWMNIR